MGLEAQRELLNRQLAHQIGLLRYSNSEVRDIVALLNAADRELLATIGARLEGRGPWTTQRLRDLRAEIRRISIAVHKAAGLKLSEDLREFAEYEADFQRRMLRSVIPAAIPVNLRSPDLGLLRAAVTAEPLEGELLRPWFGRLAESRSADIMAALRLGIVQGEGVPDMMRRIRGTKAMGWKDGILNISRRHVESLTRTAVMHTAGQARDATYDANGRYIRAIQWVSTLDGRTTDLCMARDGRLYTVDHEPIDHQYAWESGPSRLHWQCRSTSVAIMKTFREMRAERQAVKVAGATKRPTSLKDIAHQTPHPGGGQVPASLKYSQWLRQQPAARQDFILGKKRGALYRSGRIDFDAFFNNRGEFWTLKELKLREGLAA